MALGILVGLPAAPPAGGAEPWVALRSPAPGAPLSGPTELAADVEAQSGVAEVRFVVDDVVVAILETPPWRVVVDLGGEVREHRLAVEVVDRHGATARAGLVAPAFRVDEEIDLALRQVYVTVTANGAPELGASDFRLFDEGRRMELVTFERGDVPLTAQLLLDASASMRGDRLRAALAGARAFVSGMAPLDQASLLLFSDRVRHATPFTSVPEVLGAGLGVVEAGGSTALDDHLYLALRRLERRQGRRVLVLLSDGLDVASVLPITEVLELAERLDVQVYWIRLAEGGGAVGHLTAWRDAAEHEAERRGLARLVERSGGRVVDLPSITAAVAAFSEVLAELRGQVVLGYYPPEVETPGWRRLRVEVGVPGARVRAAEGYFATPPAAGD